MGMRKAIVTSHDSRIYYGEFDPETLKEGGPIELHNVYQLLILDSRVSVDPTKQAWGIARDTMMMSFVGKRGAIDKFYVFPAGWLFLDECGLEDVYEQMQKKVESELEQRREMPAGPPSIVPASAGVPFAAVPTLTDLMKKR